MRHSFHRYFGVFSDFFQDIFFSILGNVVPVGMTNNDPGKKMPVSPPP